MSEAHAVSEVGKALLDQRWDDFYSFRADAASRLASLETQSAVEQVHRENVEKRLGAIEGNTKWLVRLIVGGMVTTLVTFALSGGFALPSPSP